ncbi:MAG: methyltransferase type 12 [Gammaproteobacteria bacterium]|nr:MAG: methyltransferase type 12 [Gammaproteobacteria bacterium]
MVSGVQLEDKQCPNGCEDDDKLVLNAKDIICNLPGEFSVVSCQSCGLLRTNPRPTPETIGFYYPDDYGPYQGTKVSQKELAGLKRVSWLRKFIRKLFKFNTNCLPKVNPGRMLEIGCASGAFMHKMANEGWDVEGIEFSEAAAESARQLGYNVFAGAVECAPEPLVKYDLIVGWMVIEHLHDPIKALKKMRSWVKPGGQLVISVPNAGSIEFRVFKRNWYALQVPNHLYHFDTETLTEVLRKSGWRTQKIYHQRVLGNLVASLGYVCNEKFGESFFSNWLMRFPLASGRLVYLMYPLAFIMSLFGQTGRMTIWAVGADLDEK